MKVTTEITDTRVVTLSIEPDVDQINKARRRAASTFSRVRPVPGFRPGKAPLSMVERIFGAETILKEAVDNSAEEIFLQAVVEAGIRPLQAGQMEIASTDPLLLKIEVALVPTVELGQYQTLRITPEPEAKVADDVVDAEVEALREQAATYEPVERPIMATDMAVLEMTATEDDQVVLQEEAFELHVTPQDEPYSLVDKLLAMRVGESAKVTAEYPDEYGNKALAGKTVDLQFTVKAVREKTLPEVNDEFAKDVSDHETLEALRQSITDRLQEEMDTARRNRETEAALEAIVGASKVEYPVAAVDREIESMIGSERARVQSYGFDWANYLRIMRTSEEQMRSEMRPRAEQRLVRGLVLSEFALAEGLEVDPSETSAEFERILAQYGERADEARQALLASGAMASLENDLLSRKTVEHLVAVLTGRSEPQAAAPAAQAAQAAEEAAEAAEEAPEADEEAPEADEAPAATDTAEPAADPEADPDA